MKDCLFLFLQLLALSVGMIVAVVLVGVPMKFLMLPI